MAAPAARAIRMPSPSAPAKASAWASFGETCSFIRSTLPPKPPVARMTPRRAVTRRGLPSTFTVAPVTRPPSLVNSCSEALSQIGTPLRRRLCEQPRRQRVAHQEPRAALVAQAGP